MFLESKFSNNLMYFIIFILFLEYILKKIPIFVSEKQTGKAGKRASVTPTLEE
jgi:hypothetical protein